MAEHRVLVCGGRYYDDHEVVERFLDGLNAKPTLVIHGGTLGADLCAVVWAAGVDIPTKEYRAEWRDLSHPDARIRTTRFGMKYDANAGPRRNQKMIEEGKPDLVVAFPGGAGTADMVRRAKTAGIPVIEVKP